MKNRLLLLAAAGLSLSACATSPLDTTGVNSAATPSQAVATMPGSRGERVQWGGQIVSTVNRDQFTRIEVLSYPVARDGVPNSSRKPTGRFVLQHPGFLEPVDYAPGRTITVVGTVDALMETSVGEARFVVPLVRAEQLKLWPDRYGASSRSSFGFGVGISFGF